MPDEEHTADASPSLDVRLPPTVEAWEHVQVAVVVRNESRRAILPVALKLASAQGLIESWGIAGRSTRWGVLTPGRMEGSRLEVLSGIEMQQQQAEQPSPLYAEVNTQLVRFEPLMPGAEVELTAHFDAAYQHGDRIDATLDYITIDPATRTICTAQESPARLSFVECRPVKAVEQMAGQHLYLPAAELKRDPRRVSLSVSLTIRHPALDVDAARERAGVAAGPFGYDVATARWLLVDEQAGRTLSVGEQGAVEDLPGEWLTLLLTLNRANEVSISWDTAAVPLTDDARRILSEAGISVAAFGHKDYTSSTNVLLTVNRTRAGKLAPLLQDLGAKLDGLRVVK